jgi:hypothetical protein
MPNSGQAYKMPTTTSQFNHQVKREKESITFTF